MTLITTTPKTLRVLAAMSGFIAVLLNVLAVALLSDSPHAYKEGYFTEWLQESVAQPGAAGLSAWAFTVGVILLVPFAYGLHRKLGSSSGAGAMAFIFISLGGIMNGVATMTPFVLVQHVLPACVDTANECQVIANALLGFTLSMDALFNLLFGVGMILAGGAFLKSDQWPRWLGYFGIGAGLSALPITLQAHDVFFAGFLMLAGPLWLLWVTAVSVYLLRE